MFTLLVITINLLTKKPILRNTIYKRHRDESEREGTENYFFEKY